MGADEPCGRTVFVGDVHGCAHELEELLSRIAFGSGDRLCFVGDLVVRGPQPQRVMELVRELGARAVRGNHEVRLLSWRALGARPEGELDASERRLLKSRWLRETAAALDEASWDYLAALPLWLDLDDHRVRVVHGGIVAGLAPEDHDERTLVSLRGIDADGEPSAVRGVGTPWGARYQGPPQVVFGHDAQAEPRLFTWATGLDTGCVYGGALTALVLQAAAPVPPVAERAAVLVSVKARKRYYPPEV